jgi:hypothetical protein
MTIKLRVVTMRKPYDCDHARMRKLVRPLLVLVLLFLPTTASAEICDKAVGEAWRSEHGPVWLLNPVGFPLGLTNLVGGLILLAVVRVQWLQWFGYGVSALLVLGNISLVLADLIPQHDIYLAQIREGCRSYRTDLMSMGLTLAFAVIYAWLGYRVRRRTAVGALAGT